MHEALGKPGLFGEFADNRPTATRCVHPLVTLLDRLDAISSRFVKGKEAPTFVRHHEDAAQIIRASEDSRLPPLAQTARALAEEMLAASDIRGAPPRATDPAFALAQGERRLEIEGAYEAIARMFWGPRIPLDEALETILQWCARVLA